MDDNSFRIDLLKYRSDYHRDSGQLTTLNRHVQIWQASLEQPHAVVNSLRQLLAEDELTRSDRFHFERDRRRFIVRRGCLRILLSRYLGRPPEEIQFTYSEYGKPSVAHSSAGPPLHFSLADSAGLVLYAFTCVAQIGIDIECIRPGYPGEEIARRFFSAAELRSLGEVPVETRQSAFFHCWTRKEAFIKANGMGLSLPLDRFEVTLKPGEPAMLRCTRWDDKEAAQWSLRTLEMPSGYVAAIAVRAHDWELSSRPFAPADVLSDKWLTPSRDE